MEELREWCQKRALPEALIGRQLFGLCIPASLFGLFEPRSVVVGAKPAHKHTSQRSCARGMSLLQSGHLPFDDSLMSCCNTCDEPLRSIVKPHLERVNFQMCVALPARKGLVPWQTCEGTCKNLLPGNANVSPRCAQNSWRFRVLTAIYGPIRT